MERLERPVRIIKSDSKKRYTLGVVYEPDVVDSQGDWTDAEEGLAPPRPNCVGGGTLRVTN
ncbi:MAG: hypothetical protein K6U08_00735 [Firmicutes bacterium]|nr:hypothetical protein [Bacillota bacterium]